MRAAAQSPSVAYSELEEPGMWFQIMGCLNVPWNKMRETTCAEALVTSLRRKEMADLASGCFLCSHLDRYSIHAAELEIVNRRIVVLRKSLFSERVPQ